MRRVPATTAALLILLAIVPAGRVVAGDDPLANGIAHLDQGNAAGAVAFFSNVLQAHPARDTIRGRALLLMGQALERNLEAYNSEAERRCYRSGAGGGACMQRIAAELNAKYGAGAFAYAAEIVVLRYTGSHYREVLDGWQEPELVAEATYRVLEKQLIGRPDEVLPRVKAYLAAYPKGEWGRKGRLLWARLHEDIWWIHRKWAWLLYDWNYSEDELIIRGETFRKEALRTYEALVKQDGRSAEGKVARQELELLKTNQSDGILYGIVNETMVGRGR